MKNTIATVDCFPYANANDIKHYSQPPLAKNSSAQMIIIHTGTDDLPSDCSANKIVCDIVNLATFMKNEIQSKNVIIFPSCLGVISFKRKQMK